MNPKIFYYCNDHRSAAGGHERVYRHVEILARNGYEAFAWRQEDDFRPPGLTRHAPAVDSAEFRRRFVEDNDYLVLPENLGLKILGHSGKKVIFHESLDRAFNCFGERAPDTYPYAHPSVVGVLAASDYDCRHLKFAFPGLPVFNIGMTIDPQAFSHRPLRNKRKLITWVAREKAHISLLYHTARARGQAGLNKALEYHWAPLGDLPTQDVAKALEESLLFISLSGEEGLEWAPWGAMLSGCLVAGYQFGPTKERLPIIFQCEYGEHIDITRFIEKVMASFPGQIDEWSQAVDSTRRQALDNIVTLEEKSVLEAWERVFSTNSQKTSARITTPAL